MLVSFNMKVPCFRVVIKPQNILPVMLSLNCSQNNIILLDSNSTANAMACVDVKLFHSYIGPALPVFTRNHEYCHSSLLPGHGAAVA